MILSSVPEFIDPVTVGAPTQSCVATVIFFILSMKRWKVTSRKFSILSKFEIYICPQKLQTFYDIAEKSWCKKTDPNAHCTVKNIKFNRAHFQMRKYMSDVDSTHCTPLPRDHFLLPWDPATELAFATIESESSKL